MHTLRHARYLTRLVLVWFVLSLGAAIASPIVKPQGMTLVCTASGGLKLLQPSDEGTQEAGAHTLDCPLCSAWSAPAPALVLPHVKPQAGAQALPCADEAVAPGHAGISPPPRGPPAYS